MRRTPDDVVGYGNLVFFYLPLNRLDEAKTASEEALARKLDGFSLREPMYYLAFLQGDNASMRQQAEWSVGKAGAEDILLSVQSDTEAYDGHLAGARTLLSTRSRIG